MAKVKIPIFYGDIEIFQVENINDISDIYGLVHIECDAWVYPLCVGGHNTYIMAFSDKVTHSIIAHESLHVTNLICKHAGIKLDVDNDETQAYILGFVVTACYKHLKKVNYD